MLTEGTFRTLSGLAVPSVTTAEMREVDRVAVDEFGLTILQMMENAGHALALNVVEMLEWGEVSPEVAILAGSGGNGGGGLCCARHLHNRGFRVSVLLSKNPAELRGTAAHQLRTLRAAGLKPVEPARADEVLRRSGLVVDALIGYSLHGAPRGRTAEMIERCNEHAARVLSLDLPSGLDATTGRALGAVVQPERTLTLALPKTGLRDVRGELYLADIGIPPEVYGTLGLSFDWPSPNQCWIQLAS